MPDRELSGRWKAKVLWTHNAYKKVQRRGEFPTLLDSWKDRDSFQGNWRKDLTDEDLLRAWITRNGGFIHPDLHLTESPSCHGRGWVAAKDIDLQTVSTEPLIVVPLGLRLHSKDAIAMLQQVLIDIGWRGTLEDLPNAMYFLHSGIPLAACLAYERKKGRQSPFYPFMKLLPEDAPSLWLKKKAEVKRHVSTLGLTHRQASIVEGQVQIDKEEYLTAIRRFMSCTPFAAALGVTEADVQWGLSQVLTRQHSGGAAGNIKPAFDFLNHHGSAGMIMVMAFNQPDLSKAPGKALQLLMSLKDGSPQPLRAGDELFVLYPGPDTSNPERLMLSSAAIFGAVLDEPVGPKPHSVKGPYVYHDVLSSSDSDWTPSQDQWTDLMRDLKELIQQEPDHPIYKLVLRPVGFEILGRLQCVNGACPRERVPLGTKQLKCSVCRTPYCSQACQEAHWRQHKPHCKQRAGSLN